MASELPYFKFEVLSYLTGDICLERWELQGIFNNVCAFYWSKNCDLSLTTLYKKYRGSEELINELIELDVFKTEGDYLSINFLNEQWSSKEVQKQINLINGKKGGRPTQCKASEMRVYIIRCFNASENFYKLGVTNASIQRRFSSGEGGSNAMPYSYEIILDQICFYALSYEIEKYISSIFIKYNPLISFGGCKECFIIDEQIVIEVKKAISNGKITELVNYGLSNEEPKLTNIEKSKEEKIIVEESKENDFAFNSLKSDLVDALVLHYGFTEMRFANSQKQIFQFVNTQMKNEEDVAHFKNQFSNYQEYKKLSKENIHNFTGYLGTPAMQFQNSAWNSENWAEKLNRIKKSATSKGQRTADIYNNIKNPYENGDTTL